MGDISEFFNGLFDAARGGFQDFVQYRLIRNEQELANRYSAGVNSYYRDGQPVTSWSNPNGAGSLMPMLLIGGAALVGVVLLTRK
ncbi:hypothetical protein [Oceanibaculum indicum]|uniref:Uncharacterized protein n=1 Tax=Oceanibaculum indicum TaxID=526216 RepID=A0A420WQE3_9PROT|nr:hypothetical protein [Oceanibaculum indicum]RKQ73105.1 hypothetical protein BCL74_0878 [Oceanibaculum indicum]